jgi:hypothetical protein
MTDLVRPYADLENIFESVEYRANLTEPFQPIDVSDDVAAQIVRVDDLRTIPQHQLRVRLRMQALKPHYDRHKDNLRLVIVVRDTTLRRELLLAEFPIDSIPATIEFDRSLLRTTGLRDTLPLNLSIISVEVLKGDKALPTQRASRLAELQIVLRNSADGATFPYKRVTADDLKRKDYPPETGLHLELLCDPVELITESNTPIRNLFEVWVHEKIWGAIQNDRAPASSRLRLSAVTISTSNLLLSAVVPCLKGSAVIQEGSVVGQLLAHAEKQASLPEGRLRRQFQQEASLHSLEPYIQNAWRFVSSAGKIDEEESAE